MTIDLIIVVQGSRYTPAQIKKYDLEARIKRNISREIARHNAERPFVLYDDFPGISEFVESKCKEFSVESYGIKPQPRFGTRIGNALNIGLINFVFGAINQNPGLKVVLLSFLKESDGRKSKTRELIHLFAKNDLETVVWEMRD